MEAWKRSDIGWDFRQMNVSFSKAGVVRGLHYRARKPEVKLVYCLSGRIEDAGVCLRCGEIKAFDLFPRAGGVLVPPGWAHGFRAKEDSIVAYLVSEEYNHSDACGINPFDKNLALPWLYMQDPIVSEQDKKWPGFDGR